MDKLTSILVATPDAGCSAALLDKALILARAFDARVELLETTSHDDILARLRRGPVDLVIKPPASAHPLRRWSLEANDLRLLEHSPVPVLLARARPWAQPLRLAAAVDVSDRDSEALTRGILQVSGFLALGTSGILDVLYAERERDDSALRMARAVKLASLVREFRVGCEHLQMFDGAPEKTLAPLLARRHYDLLVLGGVTRRSGLGAMLQPLNGQLADAAGADVLLVGPTVPHAAAGPSPRSTGDQLLHQREQLA
jgi:nucleotide-binding universal stress UspA family protein